MGCAIASSSTTKRVVTRVNGPAHLPSRAFLLFLSFSIFFFLPALPSFSPPRSPTIRHWPNRRLLPPAPPLYAFSVASAGPSPPDLPFIPPSLALAIVPTPTPSSFILTSTCVAMARCRIGPDSSLVLRSTCASLSPHPVTHLCLIDIAP